MHVASSKGNVLFVQALINKGSNKNEKDIFGNSALHYACDKGRKAVVELLLSSGAHVNIADNRGNTPIHNACLINDLSIVHVLLANGAIPDQLDFGNVKPADKTSSQSIKLAIENYLKLQKDGGASQGSQAVNWMGLGMGLGIGIGMAMIRQQQAILEAQVRERVAIAEINQQRQEGRAPRSRGHLKESHGSIDLQHKK